MTYEQRRNLSTVYNPFTIRELQTTYPYVNWLEYFNGKFQSIQQIDEHEVVIVIDKNYLHQLNGLLQSTPNRTIANYFAWRLVQFTSDFLNDDLHQRKRQYFKESELTPEIRLTECVKKTMAQ